MDSDFMPEVWLEHQMPLGAMDYEQCEVCSERSRIIWGEGNPKAPIVIIQDNPGEREDKDGREYVCGTRRTLQRAAYEAKLKVEDIYLTYLLKCRPLRKYDKEKARSFSKPYLIQQIEAIQPKFIMCLGDVVVQAMFENNEAHVKDLRGSWHNIMGYPTIVSYHPLGVRRRPNLMGHFMQDWRMLAEGVATDLKSHDY